MEVSNRSMSLFDYIGGNDQPQKSLENIAKHSQRDVAAGFSQFHQNLQSGDWESTLEAMKKGEIDLDLDLINNYFMFNQQKLDREVAQLAEQYELPSPLAIRVGQDGLEVESEQGQSKALQHLLDKDQRLTKLVQQTAKLSQFVEWGEAKQQAAIDKEQGMSDEDIVNFLKQARTVVTDSNYLIIEKQASGFSSVGSTASLLQNRESSTVS